MTLALTATFLLLAFRASAKKPKTKEEFSKGLVGLHGELGADSGFSDLD